VLFEKKFPFDIYEIIFFINIWNINNESGVAAIRGYYTYYNRN